MHQSIEKRGVAYEEKKDRIPCRFRQKLRTIRIRTMRRRNTSLEKRANSKNSFIFL